MRKVEEDMMEYLKVSNRLEHERKKHSLALQYQKFADEKDNEVGVVCTIPVGVSYYWNGCGLLYLEHVRSGTKSTGNFVR